MAVVNRVTGEVRHAGRVLLKERRTRTHMSDWTERWDEDGYLYWNGEDAVWAWTGSDEYVEVDADPATVSAHALWVAEREEAGRRKVAASQFVQEWYRAKLPRMHKEVVFYRGRKLTVISDFLFLRGLGLAQEFF